MIDVIIPSYGRADRLVRVVEDVHASLDVQHRVTFVLETDDTASYQAAYKTDARVLSNTRTASYAGAMNTACLATDADFIFMGADDLHFHKGWFTQAHALMDGRTMVVGTNDLFNPAVLAGRSSTHHLVDMRYIRETGGTPDEGPGVALHEGYDHNYVDTEFIEVAKARGVFAPCLTSVVEHLHMLAHKAPVDATYERGFKNWERDQDTFRSRVHLWT